VHGASPLAHQEAFAHAADKRPSAGNRHVNCGTIRHRALRSAFAAQVQPLDHPSRTALHPTTSRSPQRAGSCSATPRGCVQVAKMSRIGADTDACLNGATPAHWLQSTAAQGRSLRRARARQNHLLAVACWPNSRQMPRLSPLTGVGHRCPRLLLGPRLALLQQLD
jgi:hypothetical protein